jgi:hypothetical protein
VEGAGIWSSIPNSLENERLTFYFFLFVENFIDEGFLFSSKIHQLVWYH